VTPADVQPRVSVVPWAVVEHPVVAAHDLVAVRATGYGQHRSDHLGVPASGRPYAMPSMHLWRGKAIDSPSTGACGTS